MDAMRAASFSPSSPTTLLSLRRPSLSSPLFPLRFGRRLLLSPPPPALRMGTPRTISAAAVDGSPVGASDEAQQFGALVGGGVITFRGPVVLRFSENAAGSFLRTVLSRMEQVYLSRNPSAKTILDLVRSNDGAHICYDHFAFRTFGVDGYGIDSVAQFFLDFGYSPRDKLKFPKKKLEAIWFSPPNHLQGTNGSGINGPLPRIFISELLVDEMSHQAQEIIRRYTKISASGNKYATLASATGSLTWGRPLYIDYQQLSSESEYAAWTLVNGYALNHLTISTHRLKSHIREINNLNKFIEDSGFKLNSEGGVLKVSPDGLLLQSSTVADSTTFQFAEGTTDLVPCSYIEFAERLVLPPYKNLLDEEIKEYHRRDGFEVGNADKIFESTSNEQLSKKTV